MYRVLNIGLDIGSTTVKMVVVDSKKNVIFKRYTRHLSDIKKTIITAFDEAREFIDKDRVRMIITGSGGFDISKQLEVPFIQEVIACSKAIKVLVPDTDVAIELGGEDAKITYFGDSIEQRMNGSCAGGTGAFIDQMAALLQTDAEGINEILNHILYISNL